jgi:hypothetical protein
MSTGGDLTDDNADEDGTFLNLIITTDMEVGAAMWSETNFGPTGHHHP